jgi:outer membrane protein insertion porin family
MLWLVFFFDAGSLWTDGFWERGLDYSTQMTHAKDRLNGDLHNIDRFFNVNLMSYFKYSWGFGFKIQIPMMPLRFWFGKKLVWVGKDHGFFRQEGDLNFQFGIGDMRF